MYKSKSPKYIQYLQLNNLLFTWNYHFHVVLLEITHM